jgi:hypothetical protein
MGVVHGQAPLAKKPVMLCRCRTTLNAGAMPGLFPLPQLQAPSRVAGSFVGPKPVFAMKMGEMNNKLAAAANAKANVKGGHPFTS